MKLHALVSAGLIVPVLGLVGFYMMTTPAMLPADALQPRSANLANGETIFQRRRLRFVPRNTGPEQPLTTAGGRPLQTQFGVFKVPNISSDAKVGIGAWSEQEFANAMLKGVGRNNEHLYPVFPIPPPAHVARGRPRSLRVLGDPAARLDARAGP